jgi:small neutral amino acid transporter SnatA (MarC family)
VSVSEIIIGLVGAMLLIFGIIGVKFRNNRWITNFIGETGYRILISVIGITLLILALFTNILYEV